MQTGPAIIVAAVIVAATGAGTVFAVQPRYSVSSPGEGVTMRLDRRTGDMIGCRALACLPVVKGDKALAAPASSTDLPPGYTLDK